MSKLHILLRYILKWFLILAKMSAFLCLFRTGFSRNLVWHVRFNIHLWGGRIVERFSFCTLFTLLIKGKKCICKSRSLCSHLAILANSDGLFFVLYNKTKWSMSISEPFKTMISKICMFVRYRNCKYLKINVSTNHNCR